MQESIKWFSEEMDNIIKSNDEQKGIEGWHECSPYELSQGLEKNVHELKVLLVTNKDKVSIIKTATDIANYSMMIADKARRY